MEIGEINFSDEVRALNQEALAGMQTGKTAKPSKSYAMTEEEFGSQVEDLLERFGWRWMHSRPARTIDGWRTALSGDKGFPDYTAARLSRLLFIEIKSETGKLTPEQTEWNDALRECQHQFIGESSKGKGIIIPEPVVPEVYIWKPSDFDFMVKVLS